MAKKRLLRTQLVTMRLPRETLRRLDVLALEQEKYRSELMVQAIQEYLSRDRALDESGRRTAGGKEAV